MSTYYTLGNSESSIDLFYKKFNYKFSIERMSAGYGNLKDFTYGEKFLYGRVDRNYVPIILNEMSQTPKSIQMGDGLSPTLLALPFVADAFADLSLQFQKSHVAGKLDTSDKFLSTIRAVRAYENPKKLYAAHMNSLLLGIRDAFRIDNVRYRTFEEFIPLFINALQSVTELLPYTLPAFMKHRLCPITATGLVIEISSGDFSKDLDKIDNFVNSPNWKFYLNACRSYGFSVDMHAPWRLIADIGTQVMVNYASKYSLYNTEFILGNAYHAAHISYYKQFVSMIETAYKFLKTDNYVEVDYCQDGSTRTKLVTPIVYPSGDLLKKFGETYFLKMYLEIRMMEEESKLQKNEKQQLIQETMDVYLAGKPDKALMAFERVIGKTFDYSGSLTNRRKGAKLRKEDALREEDLDNAVSTYR